MPIYTTPILNINLKKLVSNYQLLQKLSGSAIAAAVVKDDSYGLGATEVTETLYKEGCRHFFVAHGSEGAIIRKVAPEATIFALQGIGEDSLNTGNLLQRYVKFLEIAQNCRYSSGNTSRNRLKPLRFQL